MTKNVRWQAIFPLLKRDDDKETITSINDNCDYAISLMIKDKTKIYLKKKRKTIQKSNFISSKKGDKIVLRTALQAFTMTGFMYVVARYQEFKSPIRACLLKV